jgi:hypothetical protein
MVVAIVRERWIALGRWMGGGALAVLVAFMGSLTMIFRIFVHYR